MKIMDCTLRDGGNVVGAGFSRELTTMILRGLTENRVPIIEMGNAKGLGAYDIAKSIAPLSDEEYMELAQPFLSRAEIGMFLNAKRFRGQNVEMAARYGLSFLRVGADAGDWNIAENAVRCVKENGMKVYYALMKAYLSTPEELAQEALYLENMGADEITIMDSAGTMWPGDAERYTTVMKSMVHIPVGFHSHNNMYFAVANCEAAERAGADIIDGGLLGMARSAGNISTEACVAMLYKKGIRCDVDFYGLLHFLDDKLIPAMEKYGYHRYIAPIDLILGYSGCHSSFLPRLRAIADETRVDLYRLIIEVSAIDRKAPSEKLIYSVAETLQYAKI